MLGLAIEAHLQVAQHAAVVEVHQVALVVPALLAGRRRALQLRRVVGKQLVAWMGLGLGLGLGLGVGLG